ncbi:hypothetical protein Q5P01_001517 [Channa striata]|uniref:Uncharacterized protein n=1 Tax=Channa striata TaxID=64152 RepID=A0AA88NSN8_CHASR|nr:hypothetical protein Q5P01_001517 [Channa striata]
MRSSVNEITNVKITIAAPVKNKRNVTKSAEWMQGRLSFLGKEIQFVLSGFDVCMREDFLKTKEAITQGPLGL